MTANNTSIQKKKSVWSLRKQYLAQGLSYLFTSFLFLFMFIVDTFNLKHISNLFYTVFYVLIGTSIFLLIFFLLKRSSNKIEKDDELSLHTMRKADRIADISIMLTIVLIPMAISIIRSDEWSITLNSHTIIFFATFMIQFKSALGKFIFIYLDAKNAGGEDE